MRFLLIGILLASSFPGFGQQVIDVNNTDLRGPLLGSVNGEPVNFYKYVKVVEGSPFLDTGWLMGSVTLASGRFVDNIPLKLNLLDQEVYYKDKLGKEWVSSEAMKELTLMKPQTMQVWQFDFFQKPDPGNAHLPHGWLEMLYTGANATFYKKHEKKLVEQKPYGSAISEQYIRNRYQYFVVHAGQWYPIKKWQDIGSIFNEKAEALKDLEKKERLDMAKRDDWDKVGRLINQK